jgi:hypothetical protein
MRHRLSLLSVAALLAFAPLAHAGSLDGETDDGQVIVPPPAGGGSLGGLGGAGAAAAGVLFIGLIAAASGSGSGSH